MSSTRSEDSTRQEPGVDSSTFEAQQDDLTRRTESSPPERLFEAFGSTIYIYSRDRALIETLQAAAYGLPLRFGRNWRRLVRQVKTTRSPVVLIDAELTGSSLKERISVLREVAPDLILILAAPRKTAQELVEMTASGGAIHRLLVKPASPGLARRSLESAVRRSLESTDHTRRLSAPRGDVLQSEWTRPKLALWIGAVALLSFGVGVVLPLLLQESPSEMLSRFLPGFGEEVSETGSLTTSAVGSRGNEGGGVAVRDDTRASVSPDPDRGSEPFRDQLSRADLAFAEGRLVEPPGDNALEILTGILAEQPEHDGARRRLDRLVDSVLAETQAAITAGEFDEAERLLGSIGAVRSASARSGALLARLEERRSDRQEAGVAVAGGVPQLTSDESEPALGESREAAEDVQQQQVLPESRGAAEELLPPRDEPPALAEESQEVSAGLREATEASRPVVAESREAAEGSQPGETPSRAGADDSAGLAVSSRNDAGTEDEDFGTAAPVVNDNDARVTQSESSASANPQQTQPDPELGRLIALADQSIREARLLEPPGNNARFYLSLAQERYPIDLAVFDLRERLGDAVVAEARSAIRSDDLGQAQNLVDAAFVLGVDIRTLEELDSNLAARLEAARRSPR